jgi:hypothetical protein
VEPTSEQQATTETRRSEIGQGRGAKRQYTNRGAKSGHVSPAIIVKYLRGMHYPANKKNMIDSAQNKKAPPDVVDMITKLPDKTYKSPIDVTKEESVSKGITYKVPDFLSRTVDMKTSKQRHS